MKLVLEQTQQGSSYEVSVSAEGVEELKRKVKIKGEKKEDILTLRQKPSQYISCLELQRRLLTLKTNIIEPRRSIKLILYKVLKLKNIKKDGYTCFQHQEQYEHDGPVVTRLQEGQRSQDDDNRLCLVDDLKDTSSSLKSMITTTFHKLKIEVKDYELKTKVKA
ncbi:hypothetical protein Tco_1244837 [Tanacetum coccineum]